MKGRTLQCSSCKRRVVIFVDATCWCMTCGRQMRPEIAQKFGGGPITKTRQAKIFENSEH